MHPPPPPPLPKGTRPAMYTHTAVGGSVHNVRETTVYCDLKHSLRDRTEQLTEAGGVGVGVGTGSGP